ncbi:MAG: Ig-like domain-containing protein [Candidatus Schekmanbacteria bacterium]|nr:Ig-like domain-containing protein [Candidatus Schekmanbacteria bacterium]
MAAVLLLALVPFLMQGCVQIKVKVQGAAESGVAAAVEEARLDVPDGPLSMFRFLAVQKSKHADNPQFAVPYLVASLWRQTDHGREVVWRERHGTWQVGGLPSGTYVVKVERVFDNKGKEEDASGETEKTFHLGPGQLAQAQVVLEKTPVGLIIVLAVTIVLLAVILFILAREGADLSLPDLSVMPAPPGLIVPPALPVPSDPAAIHLAIDLIPPPSIELAEGIYVSGGEEDEEPASRSFVQWYGPAHGAEHVGAGSAIEIVLRQPVDPLTVDQGTFVAYSERGQLLGGISVDAEHRRLRLTPLFPLPQGEQVTVRFLGSYVRLLDDDGVPLDEVVGSNYTWQFTTTAG